MRDIASQSMRSFIFSSRAVARASSSDSGSSQHVLFLLRGVFHEISRLEPCRSRCRSDDERSRLRDYVPCRYAPGNVQGRKPASSLREHVDNVGKKEDDDAQADGDEKALANSYE